MKVEAKKMDNMDDTKNIWIGKKVFISIKNNNRKYTGRVISENDNSITIIDVMANQVFINKDSVDFIQEEKK